MIEFWYILTLLSEPEAWGVIGLCLIGIYLLLRKTRLKGHPNLVLFKRFVIIFVISLFITYGLVLLLKAVLQVPRTCTPCPGTGCNPYCLPDYSFPSGHSATAFVLFTTMYLVIRKRRLLPVFIIPILMALSRIFLGVHTYSDVFCGAAIGFLITLGVWKKRLFLQKKLLKKPVF